MSLELDEVKEWLHKARNDLLSARILMEHDPPVLDTALFHCQQAVEKVLKAFLVWKAVPFERVHSLTYLLDLCEAQDATVASLREQAEMLTPFAVEVRYPGAEVGISREQALDALVAAGAIWKCLLDLLPAELRTFTEGSPESRT